MNNRFLNALLACTLAIGAIGLSAHTAQAQSGLTTTTLVPGPVTLVNTITANYQGIKTSAALDDGGFLIVWVTDTSDPSPAYFSFQRFDSAGAKVGAETRLPLLVQDGILTVLGNGDIVAVYRDSRNAKGERIFAPGARGDVYIQKFNKSGAQVLRETTVATTFDQPSVFNLAGVVALTDESYVVYWTASTSLADTSSTTFYAQKYGNSGNPIGSRIALSTKSTPPFAPRALEYAISQAPNGGFLLQKSGIDSLNGSGCAGSRSPPIASQFVYYDQHLSPREILPPTHCAALLPLHDGNYMLFNDAALTSQLLGPDGVPMAGMKPINAKSQFVAVTRFVGRQVLADGTYILIWLSDSSDFRVQRYTNKGDPIGEAVAVAPLLDSILPLAGGDAILAWSATSDIPNNLEDVYMRRLSRPEGAVCIKPAPWVMGQQYNAGARVSYSNGLTYVAKFANPGYNPTISTYFWAPFTCADSHTPPPACIKPAAWVRDQPYNAGASVSYSNGLTYVAKFANPGYNPTISTYFWAPFTCADSPTPPPACSKPAAWVRDQPYAAGARVSYSNGLTYVAKFANPGYNPTISTYFWSPVGC